MRRLIPLPLTVLLLVPASASAFTFSSTVTTPASGTRLVFDHSSPPHLTIAGTANSVGTVDLECVHGSIGSTNVTATLLAGSVPVSSGTFTASNVAWPNDDLCDVVAVQSGTNPTTDADLAGATGALVYSAISFPRTTGGKIYDFDVDASSTLAYSQLESFGTNPLEYQEPLDAYRYGPLIHDAGAQLAFQDPSSSTAAPGLRIDGRPAYTTAAIGYNGALNGLAGWNGLALSVTDDSGTFHVVSHEDTFDCMGGSAPDAFPPTASSCGGFTSSGVSVVDDERIPGDGRTVIQNLTYTSNDGKSHTVAPVLSDLTEVAREWLFPGTADFLPYTTGQSPSTVAPGPATIRNRVGGDASQGFGAITYVRQPADEVFTKPGWQVTQHYPPVTVPAGGSARFEFVYAIDPTSAGLDALVAANQALIGAPPAIAVTSATSTTTAAYALTGTVNAPERLSGLTVDGQPVATASDGSFSVPRTLAAGATTFTLAASDELGRTTTTPFTVTLSTPPPASPLAVRFGRRGKPRLKGRVVTTGLTATCPGTGPSCSIAATATSARRQAGRGSANARAGATVAIKLKLTAKALATLRRRHTLRLALKLSGRRSGAATTTARRTVTLKLRR